ncbi:protein spire homolog 1-like isoform X2 [Gigantopelta aegis]|uniref:protein spire homolog 1-like isoform X2 n=1 Tax=Gigantopelta aegis TaxID=1735272 RepID=UPI001B88D5F5|nr:protein spire homolog 1-like isoform X2 [Gigantopelta aegis]
MANVDMCRLDIAEKEYLSFTDINKVFNNPINEEQAWAVCYQCAQYYLTGQPQEKYQELFIYGSESLRLGKDGEVHINILCNGSGKGPPPKRSSLYKKSSHIATEQDVLRVLGTIIFRALDYGLGEHDERILSHDLQDLIDGMTCLDDDDDEEEAQWQDDEGIGREPEDEDERQRQADNKRFTFFDVVMLCTRRLSSRQDARHHYKAVCRALVTEAQELISFLDTISTEKQHLAKTSNDVVATVEELQRGDWAWLWVQVMRQLRHGVRLKKVEQINFSQPPSEFEMTPFEMILDDIRSRRYTLQKIMVNADYHPTVRNDAHTVILDFIRSRPPLRKVNDRKLKPKPVVAPGPIESLLNDIRSMPKLKPVKNGRLVVETSRTKLNTKDEEEEPQPARKVIKPDFSLLFNTSTESEASDDEFEPEEKVRRRSVAISQVSPMSPVSPIKDPSTETVRHRPATRDQSMQERVCKLQRRHTIMVCESPTDGSKVVQNELPPLTEDPERESEEEAELESQSQGACARLSSHVCSAESLRQHNHSLQASQNNCWHSAGLRSERKSSIVSLSAIPEVDDSPTDSSEGHECVSDTNGDVSISQLSASELMHVSWKTACQRSSGSCSASSCQDCRPKPGPLCELLENLWFFTVVKKRWQNPIECLNLTLEEVTHIRSVLTKAELESLITQPTLYSQVSKGKLCFTCKKSKFTIFGEWGTKCKFCKRTVCSKCLRKMHVPTEHFKNIPVYTLSPTPISPETKEAIQKFINSAPVGSVPVASESQQRRVNLDNRPGKKKPLQRSQSMLVKPSPSADTKGPLMNICCDCKALVTEIVRAGRTSISLINQNKDGSVEGAAK